MTALVATGLVATGTLVSTWALILIGTLIQLGIHAAQNTDIRLLARQITWADGTTIAADAIFSATYLVIASRSFSTPVRHPLLDATEGMLDDLATPVENLGPRLQTGFHAVEHRLVLQARDPAQVGRAARTQRTAGARRRIAVIDFLQTAQLALVVRQQGFPAGQMYTSPLGS